MGKDIRGWVEVRHCSELIKPPDNIWWHGVISIGSLIDRNYDMFSSLFGSAYSSRPFTPVAPHRGLPNDISEEASDDYLSWDAVMGETWISWIEIQTIDWDEGTLDNRPHEYKRDEKEQLVFVQESAPAAMDVIFEGNTWQIGDSVFKVEKISRREALSGD